MTNYKTIKASIKRLKDLEFLAEENFAQFGQKRSVNDDTRNGKIRA
ncbi:SSU ribosomal protein S2p (SAe) [uncultured Gammaproteobacteria bacterium]|nr:SSU ribosomal protein S2p (SAe) [uncultured Gammaproteobacteria bacterium]